MKKNMDENYINMYGSKKAMKKKAWDYDNYRFADGVAETLNNGGWLVIGDYSGEFAPTAFFVDDYGFLTAMNPELGTWTHSRNVEDIAFMASQRLDAGMDVVTGYDKAEMNLVYDKMVDAYWSFHKEGKRELGIKGYGAVENYRGYKVSERNGEVVVSKNGGKPIKVNGFYFDFAKTKTEAIHRFIDDLVTDSRYAAKKVALSAAKNKQLMEDIITYLYLHGLEEDVTFFTNGHRYCTVDLHGNGIARSVNGFAYYDLGECNPMTYVEYGNPKTIIMTFEGELYDEYDMGTNTVDDISDIADKYGLFPEQGYSWSLSFYKK